MILSAKMYQNEYFQFLKKIKLILNFDFQYFDSNRKYNFKSI